MVNRADLPPSTLRVAEAAEALGHPIAIVVTDGSARTAEEAANACGTSVSQIVKSLVFVGAESDRPILLLVSGSNRVNEKAVAKKLGEALKRPDAQRVRAETGFAIGGIPPFGHSKALTTYIDPDLLAFAEVWAAAGTPNTVFPIAPERLKDLTRADVLAMG